MIKICADPHNARGANIHANGSLINFIAAATKIKHKTGQIWFKL